MIVAGVMPEKQRSGETIVLRTDVAGSLSELASELRREVPTRAVVELGNICSVSQHHEIGRSPPPTSGAAGGADHRPGAAANQDGPWPTRADR